MSTDPTCFDDTEALEEECRRLREENAALKSLLAKIVSSLATVENLTYDPNVGGENTQWEARPINVNWVYTKNTQWSFKHPK